MLDTQLDTVELQGIIRVQDNITEFWLSLFQRQINFTQQEIQFDLVTDGTRELAPFVSPNVQGRVLRDKGYNTKTFRPAYIKAKHVVDPTKAIARRPGEAITGEQTLQQRFDAAVADNGAKQKKMIQNRWEWMAARAVIDGAVTVTGEDYPTVTVDFGRDPSLTGTLLGTARWGLLSANPLKDIELYRRRVQRLASSSITRLVFGLDAWDKFASNPKVQKLLDSRIRGSDTVFNRAIPEGVPFEYRGSLQGQGGMGSLELYTYSDFYTVVDPVTGAKTQVDFMDSNVVVGLGPGLDGVRCFGAIMDKKAGLASTDMFPKVWDQEDPSVTYMMTQSAPLMVPTQPNASFTLNVGDAAIEEPTT